VVSTANRTSAASAPAKAPVNAPAKPKLVPPPQPIEKARDTNKLPPLVEPIPVAETPVPAAKPIETVTPIPETPAASGPLPEIKRIQIKADVTEEPIAQPFDDYNEDIEDLAPFSMRFGAGLFDLIIGSFASLLLLSPIAFAGTTYTTAAALMTFGATTAIVMFLYMTICLGFFGKTMGMRLFSLELVDALENEYPTLRQAAVNSAIFLISLCVAGAGFLTVFFNEERRALHDLLSGTILVREF
jgi:uncharacterized RDD family membrane protein YckC